MSFTFRYPPRSAPALLDGACPLGFASKIRNWRLPTEEGSVANLVTVGGEEVGIVRVESGGDGVKLCTPRG